MAETPHSRIVDSMKPDGFVDYYQLLDVAPDATTTRIRGQVNDLYTEAQANRDHRNLNKRREYQLLLELLPQAREILLDDNRRARYDAYIDEMKRGTASISFEDLVYELTNKDAAVSPEKTNILGVREGEREAPIDTKTKSKKSAAPRQPKLSTSAENSLRGSALSVIIFALVLGILLVLRFEFGLALLISSFIALIIWVVTHFVINKTPVR